MQLTRLEVRTRVLPCSQHQSSHSADHDDTKDGISSLRYVTSSSESVCQAIFRISDKGYCSH
ncbi:hypothetical protein KIN20_000982 [Parelaphostrongylus tenuis]|uniref:Uncharacterized protein n=1 Tax=Parelaphostrongylus tenuis TaxID=148309 RepID=A0AAD5LTC9_PARTN|nr:hypothetical protein KIN20_000982 [Parelaphostrongylus tenuis]